MLPIFNPLISRSYAQLRNSETGSQQLARTAPGFTLIELMVVLAIIGIISSIAMVAYRNYIDTANIAKAISEIKMLSQEIDSYKISNNDILPASLSDIGRGSLLDPWGNPYQYLNYSTANPGHIRKDRSLHPLNSDYDLYSKGKDGQSAPPITAHISQDDIIRANDGRFIGLAANY